MPIAEPTSTSVDRTILGHLHERFGVRSKALVYARLALMSVAFLVLAVPAWRQALGIPMPQAASWYLALLGVHVGSFLWVGRPYARAAIFVSLCLDVLILVVVVVASGGIKSPLMPTQVVFTMLFALLYPSPLAIVPPLLTLPVVAKIDQIIGVQTLPMDLLLLLWYSALNVIVVYVVVYLEGREGVALQEVFRLQRERRQREVDSERVRIARDIHDGVGAALSAVLLQSEYLLDRATDTGLRRDLDELRETAAEGLDELRRAVSILHREFDLESSVADYVRSFALRHKIEATVDIAAAARQIDAAVTLAVFRILQEALSNVARHAHAQHVTVELGISGDDVLLQIADDGTGFLPEAATTGHYGLRNMSARAAKVRGTVQVTSSPGQGARIAVRIPLRTGGA